MKLLRKTLTILSLTCLTVSFLSCEGGTRREWKVTNNSSTEVHVEMKSQGTYLQKETIQPGETKTTTVFDTHRGAHAKVPPTQEIESFLVFNAKDTTEKSGLEDKNWVTESIKNKSIPAEYTHTFVFTVEDSDF